MKIIQINLGNHGSTGSIAIGINEVAREEGNDADLAYPWDSNNKPSREGDIHIGTKFGHRASRKFGKITGFNGCYSVFATIRILRIIDRIDPDIIHFHNLHNCYINLPMLFSYIKRKKRRVVWTLHDCWSFTGQCPYFSLVDCNKWQMGCYGCPQIDRYPPADVDRTKWMWKHKKKWFTNVENMVIVTPSEWLANLVKKSYLKEYPVRVINNGIDTTVFYPVEGDFRERMKIESLFVILGVAFEWEKRKGIDVFIKLAHRLSEEFKIVLVGTDEKVDKLLPDNIISIHRTQNQSELAELYSTSDLFLNPTREENYPTVNIEALACGTPVLTFNTGGSPEIIDESCGAVIKSGSVDETLEKIIWIKENRPFNSSDCLRRVKDMDKTVKFKEYLNLYKQLVGGIS